MENRIRVVIADDHRLFREGLHHVLGRNKNISIVGDAINGPQTVELVDDLKPDVALIDLVLPGMNGVEIIPPIKEKSPDTKPLMISTTKKEDMIFKALKAGARGFLYKDSSISDLVKAIKTVHHGELWVERKLFTMFLEANSCSEDEHQQPPDMTMSLLTAREEEVLYCLTKSYTNKEIAQELFISERTVKSHLNNIFRKLNVQGRIQAILYAINRGIKQDTG